MTTFGSVCSGIEAASVAWHPLGWRAAWLAEIEPFPAAVLAHHFPDVPNLGDMTKLPKLVLTGKAAAPDVLVGGTPCQAFSVAGMREGLNDPRGQLTIKFVELADAIDHVRVARGDDPAVIVWENVPGVLSDKGNAFGCFLGALSGEDRELQPAGGKWSNAGCVFGPARAIAWRVLDAQFFGVAQRRRRVFVVASARAGFNPAQVLFEFGSLRRDTSPRRGARTAVAALTANGVGTCGADDNQGQAGHLICQGGAEIAGERSPALTCNHEAPIVFHPTQDPIHSTQDPDTNTELAHTLGRNHGQENAVFHTTGAGWWNQDEVSGTLRAREQESHEHLAISVSLRGREGGATAELGDEVAGCLRASSGGGDKPHVLAPVNDDVRYAHYSHDYANDRITDPSGVNPALTARTTASGNLNVLAPVCVTGEVTHTLKADGFDSSEDGTGRGTPLGPVAMINMQGSKGNAVAQADGPSFTLNAMHGHDMHAVAVPVGVTIHGTDPTVRKVASYDEVAQCLRARTPGNIDNSSTTVVQQPVAYGIRTANTSSNGWGIQEEVTHTLDCAQGVAVAVALRGREGGATAELGDEVQNCLRASSGGGDKPHVLCETLYNKGFNHGGLYASTQETHAGKILRTLREAVGEEAFAQWGLGILDSLQQAEVLRQALHGLSIRPASFSRSWVVCCALGFPVYGSGWLLQSLREAGCERCSSQGWEPPEQLSRELGAYMSSLSQPGAQAERFMHDMWFAAEGFGLLRETLSAVQEVRRSNAGQRQPIHTDQACDRISASENLQGGRLPDPLSRERILREACSTGEAGHIGNACEDTERICKSGLREATFAVRRLIVEECEFLQGFPRGYTQVPYRNKPAADGPRYKALGNSMAVPCMAWIGSRIKMVLEWRAAA